MFFRRKVRELEEEIRMLKWRDDRSGMNSSQNNKWLSALSIGGYEWAALVMKHNGVPFEGAIMKSIWGASRDSVCEAILAVETVYGKKKEEIV